MSSIRLVRLIMGIMILVGLLFWKPLAYIVGIMMIIAGFTGVCLLEKLLNKLGCKDKCDLSSKT